MRRRWQNSEQVSLGHAVHVLSPWRLSGCQDCKTHKNKWGWWSLCLENSFQPRLASNRIFTHAYEKPTQQQFTLLWVKSWKSEKFQACFFSITSTQIVCSFQSKKRLYDPTKETPHCIDGKERVHTQTLWPVRVIERHVIKRQVLWQSKYWIYVVWIVICGKNNSFPCLRDVSYDDFST